MAQAIFVNLVNTTLSASIGSTATTLALASSAGLPTLETGQFFPLWLQDAATGLVHELVYVTGVSGATLTVDRAQEGTTAQDWQVGDYAFSDISAGTMPVSGISSSISDGTYIYASLTVNGKVITAIASGATPVTSFNTRTGAVTLASGDVTGALGYTPVNPASATTYSALQTYSAITVQNTLNALGNTSLSNYQELQGTIATSSTAGWTETINLATGTVQVVTLNSNGTLAFSGIAPSGYACSVVLYLEQGSSGSALVTWPTGTMWSGGTAPTLSTAAGAIDVITLTTFNGGTTWFGFLSGKGMAT